MAHKSYAEPKCYPGPVEGRFKSDADLASIRSYSKSYFDYQTCKPKEIFWWKLLNDMYTLIPHQFKKNCLVVISTHTPAYVERLNDMEKTRESLAIKKSQETWTRAGYHSIVLVGKVTNEDFLDARHLIESGGNKVASLVAEQVRSIRKELKY
jgi:hypothetical protein